VLGAARINQKTSFHLSQVDCDVNHIMINEFDDCDCLHNYLNKYMPVSVIEIQPLFMQ